jgi:hypothetical protein
VKKKQTPPARAPVPPERERIVWLLEFLRRDLTELRSGERIDLNDDMNRLLSYRDPAIDLASVEPPDGYAFALAKMRGAPDVSWPDSLVLEVQTSLKAGVALLEAGRSWKPFDKAQHPVFTLQADRTIARQYKGGSYATVMLASAIDLLVQWWPQLRRCAYEPCSVLFLPEEGRQKYHDPRCSGRARFYRLPPRNHQREKERRVLGNGPGRGSKGRKKR